MFRSVLFLLAAISSAVFAQGTWVDTTFVPPSLGFERNVMIYLPEGYNPGGSIDYPVIYWLHGWGGTPTSYNGAFTYVLNTLIADETIQPVILVKPDGWCEPYDGSYYANSELYGDFEDFIVIDLIAFTDSTFRTIPYPWMRSISGHSMGARGSMDLALRHYDLYKAVASHAGFHDEQAAIPFFLPIVLSECPEPGPPYTYDWGNGTYTDALFLEAGAYSPNLDNPPYWVDFPLDENGVFIDSVYVLWALHNPAHMIKSIPLPLDLGIWFDCGTNDSWAGCYESNVGYSDTLDALGIEHTFVSIEGGGHGLNNDRITTALVYLDGQMTGLADPQGPPGSLVLMPAVPNPFTSSTSIAFELTEPGHVTLQVFGISGRMVGSLMDSELQAGTHSVEFAADGLAGGVYLYRLQTETASETRRCVLLR